MISAAGEIVRVRKVGMGSCCRVFVLNSKSRTRSHRTNQSIARSNFISLYRYCPFLYPDTSFVFLIPHHLAKVFETGTSALESFNEIDFTPERTTKVPASEEIVLGMLDDVLLTVSHVLFLESPSFAKCEVLEAAATLLGTSISGRIVCCNSASIPFPIFLQLQLPRIYYYFIVVKHTNSCTNWIANIRIRYVIYNYGSYFCLEIF